MPGDVDSRAMRSTGPCSPSSRWLPRFRRCSFGRSPSSRPGSSPSVRGSESWAGSRRGIRSERRRRGSQRRRDGWASARSLPRTRCFRRIRRSPSSSGTGCSRTEPPSAWPAARAGRCRWERSRTPTPGAHTAAAGDPSASSTRASGRPRGDSIRSSRSWPVSGALAGALALYWFGPALFDAGIFGALLVVPCAAVVVGISLAVLAYADLRSTVEVTGPILRLRVFGGEKRARCYLAVDDGESATVLAWRLNPRQYLGLTQGETVTVATTRSLACVRWIVREQDQE